MNASRPSDWSDLPGADRVEAGIRDGGAGLDSIDALLVAIAAPRLAALGIPIPRACRERREAEIALYQALGRARVADPYSTYNALLRELVSFTRALEHRVRLERTRR